MNVYKQKRVMEAVDEIVRLYFENPDWTCKQAIEKAKELLK